MLLPRLIGARWRCPPQFRAFMHWVEAAAAEEEEGGKQPRSGGGSGHSGGGWVDRHIASTINIAGTSLGVPKSVSALLSGAHGATPGLAVLLGLSRVGAAEQPAPPSVRRELSCGCVRHARSSTHPAPPPTVSSASATRTRAYTALPSTFLCIRHTHTRIHGFAFHLPTHLPTYLPTYPPALCTLPRAILPHAPCTRIQARHATPPSSGPWRAS